MTKIEQFKMQEDRFYEVKKRILMRVIPIGLLAIIIGPIIGLPNSNNQDISIGAFAIAIPFILGAFGFGLYLAVKRQKELFNSYTLSITDNEITREQKNTPSIKIPFGDVLWITKSGNGTLIIKGKAKTDIILVPPQINNYDQLENALKLIKPLAIPAAGTFLQKYLGLLITLTLVILTIGSMITVYMAQNKIIVAISGILFIGLMLWSFVETRRNKNIDSKTKKAGWWIWVVIFSVVSIAYYKLIG